MVSSHGIGVLLGEEGLIGIAGVTQPLSVVLCQGLQPHKLILQDP